MEKSQDASVDHHVSVYEEIRPLYGTYAVKLKQLIISLLDAHVIKYQIVESRAKDALSFKDKVSRKDKKYDNPTVQLNDLCGIRIIVYYTYDVLNVSKMVMQEFNVVQEERLHQPDSFDPDRFGYLSRHLIVKLIPDRIGLSEWKFAKDLKAEIQVRTVIQHAWSAVSHELQYKQETAIPSKLRRRLYRIASLFELADDEFVGIRDEKNDLVSDAALAFAEGNLNIPITSETIEALIDDHMILKPLIQSAREVGFNTNEQGGFDSVVAEIYDVSQKLNIKTIRQLEKILKDDYRKVFKNANKVTKDWNPPSEFLILFALLSKRHGLLTVEELENYGWGIDWGKNLLEAISPEA